jgi:exonuclease SbcD
MSIRLLLIGDIHFREGEQLDDVQNCLAFAVQLADDRAVDAVLIAGDFYEGKSTEVERAVLAAALSSLSTAPGDLLRPVIGVKGNHDRPRELEVFDGFPGVCIFETPWIETVHTLGPGSMGPFGVDVLCVPWPEKAFLAANGYAGEAGDQAGSAALAAMLRGMVATRERPDRPLVVLAHLQVLGAISSSAQPLIGKAIEATLGDLQDLGAAAVVLGHVHKPQQVAAGIEYVGSLTVHDFGEEDEEKRVGILTIDDDGAATWEWIPVPCRRWVTIEVQVSEKVGVIEVASARLSDRPDSYSVVFAGANVRYRYACTEEQQHLFDHAEIARRFAGAHTLKIVPKVERAERVRAAEVAAARSPQEKLGAYGQATGTEITESHIEKLQQLESEESNAR